MAFDNFAAPNLPSPPKDYDFTYFNQLIRSLGNYFRIHDSRAPMNFGAVTTDMLRLTTFDLDITEPVNNNVSAPIASFLRISKPGQAFTITGLTNGSDGRVVILYNSTSQNMTLANESGGSDAKNRITTITGSNLVTSGTGVITLIYCVKTQRWVVIAART
jgi:hypothetical protein